MPDFASVSPCDYADALPREQFLHYTIAPLYKPIKRIAGPAFTVSCPPGDHLMLHAAVYAAQPGDVIVAHGDDNFALAGGNVCAIAKKRGIAGFIIDGVIRDLAEVREMAFPVFAKGVIPKPGKKENVTVLNQTLLCGGVSVNPGDIVVADEEGIAVIPQNRSQEVFDIAKKRALKDASMSLDEWQTQHQALIEKKLADLGFREKL
jgi:regulator of RNase E activity RraA